MPRHDIVCDTQELAIQAICAFNAWLLANAADSFIPAGWRIARSSRLPTFKPARVNVSSAPEERTEERDLFRHCGTVGDWFVHGFKADNQPEGDALSTIEISQSSSVDRMAFFRRVSEGLHQART
jgi:hypothetical protein